MDWSVSIRKADRYFAVEVNGRFVEVEVLSAREFFVEFGSVVTEAQDAMREATRETT